MTRMLQELLEFFETGESQLDREPTELSSLCQMIAEAFDDLGADVRFEGPDRLVIDAVHDHLARAIENLVDNAIKYGGNATITLATDPDWAIVSVEDNGPGIPASQFARVMHPFERSDAARSGRHPGMGLGLSIARNVAEAHGGRLELANRTGGGLRATLTFPKK